MIGTRHGTYDATLIRAALCKRSCERTVVSNHKTKTNSKPRNAASPHEVMLISIASQSEGKIRLDFRTDVKKVYGEHVPVPNSEAD